MVTKEVPLKSHLYQPKLPTPFSTELRLTSASPITLFPALHFTLV